MAPDPVTPDPAASSGWRRAVTSPSLPEVHASIAVDHAGFFRKLWAFSGPGLLVSVGYMDPGNWETDLKGGSLFGYRLLYVILISNFMAILLQHLSLKLGIVSGRDLAQACRDHFSRPVNLLLWGLCELAIAACDLAEVLGSAVALHLLFNLPLVWGVALTVLDVLVVLYLQHRGFRYIEALVLGLMVVIAACFGYEIWIAQPPWAEVAAGLVPRTEILTDRRMLYIAVGILGATVMPHNLYLHSSIVQTRAFARNEAGQAMALKFATIDSTLSLLMAFFINASILVLSAAAFHGTEHQEIGIHDAHQLLTPVLNAGLASTLFAVALLASGQNSTLTGTMAGQIVMEGFLDLRLRPWVRRLITRLLAIGPAAAAAALYGEAGVDALLLLSQVILSAQLSFAVVPLVWFTQDRRKMGRFANPTWLNLLAWLVTLAIIGLNMFLLLQTMGGLSASS